MKADPNEVIKRMQEGQAEAFDRLDLPFPGLFGRPLTLIDCQNLFCEFTKYIKLSGIVTKNLVYNKDSTKKRYRNYTPNPEKLLLWFPNKWGINQEIEEGRVRW